MVYIIPASEGCFTSCEQNFFLFVSFLFYFHLSMNITPNHPHLHQWPFLLLQIFLMAILPCPTVSTNLPFLSRFHPIFCFYFQFSVFSLFSSFSFLFSGHLQLTGLWPNYISRTAAYIAYYMHPTLFLFSFFFFFTLIFCTYDSIFLQIELIAEASSPVAVRWFSSPSTITSYSSGKLFRMWIIKFSSHTLPFCPSCSFKF